MLRFKQGFRKRLGRLRQLLHRSPTAVVQRESVSTSAITPLRDQCLEQPLRPASAEGLTFSTSSEQALNNVLRPQALTAPPSPTTLTEQGPAPSLSQVPRLIVSGPENAPNLATPVPSIPYTQDPISPRGPGVGPETKTAVSSLLGPTPASTGITSSASAQTTSRSQGGLAPGIVPASTQSNGPTLWKQAFEKLSERDKIAFPLTNTDKKVYIEGILEATKQSRDTHKENRFKFSFKGQDVIIGDIADKLITWFEKFKSIGDTIVQYDPAHAALPWACVRLLLQIAVNNKETMEVVLIGIERIARPLVRCAVYEKLYLQSTPGLSVRKSLEGALEELYVAILEFLAFAKRYLDKPPHSRPPVYSLTPYGAYLPIRIVSNTLEERKFYGLLHVEGKSHFDAIEDRESLLLKEVATAEAEMREHDHQNLEDQNEKLKLILEEMEKPITRIDFKVALMHKEFCTHIEDQKKGEILQWLSKVEYEKHHRTAKENLLENTGQWLLNTQQFREWQSSKVSSILWLHGIPGAGKTKLTCTVIEFLESMLQKHEPVVYFYCNRNEPQRRDPTILMQAIVKQLSVVLPSLPHVVKAEYDKRSQRGLAAGSLEFQESCQLVISLLQIYPETAIIIDALDESDPEERGKLLNALKIIMDSSKTPVKIFVSSRDDIDITLKLENLPNVYINAKDNSRDIERFVNREVRNAIENQRLLYGNVPYELRDQIISTIVENAHGMFQWADLQIKQLIKMRFEDDIKDGLGKLPKTLQETYSQIWDDILSGTPRELEITSRALMWIMCSLKPFNREEWASASYYPRQVPKDGGVATLFDLCRNIVKWDKELRRVVFAHLSVEEYLEKMRFSPADASLMAIKSCLSIFEDSRNLVKAADLALHPFVKYSFMYWEKHIKHVYSSGISKEEINDLVVNFLGTSIRPGQGYSMWKKFADELLRSEPSYRLPSFEKLSDALSHLESAPLNPLFAISYFWPGENFKNLWESHTFDVNSRNSAGETLLLVASIQGDEWLMDFLLEKGADINAGHNKYSCNPLVAAITVGRVGAVVKLVQEGANLNANGGYYTNILHAATHQTQMMVVKAIVAKGISTQITSAVVTAAAGVGWGGMEIMSFLLGTDTNIEITKAAVINVVERFGRDMIRLLLATNPNAEITEMAAIKVVEKSNCEIVRLLIQHPNTEITETVFIEIIKRFGAKPTELLLERTPKVRVSEATILEIVKKFDKTTTIRLLWRTPKVEIAEAILIEIVKKFDVGTMELLLAQNPKVKITESVIAAAAINMSWGPEVTKFLLTINTNIEITETVVVAAAGNKWTSKVIELLLARDANIRITKKVLSAAIGNKPKGPKVMLLFLDKVTDIEITDTDILEIAEIFDEEIVALILAKNPGIEITEAVFLAAARNGVYGHKIMKLLLEKTPTIDITEEATMELVKRSSKDIAKLVIRGSSIVKIMEEFVVANLRPTKTSTIEITEKFVKAVSWDQRSGQKIMLMLLSRGPNIRVTVTALLEITRRFDEKIIWWLLVKGPTIETTEMSVLELVKRLDEGVMVLLLAKPPTIEITREVVKAAARNSLNGKGIILMLLLVKYPNIRITEAAVFDIIRSFDHNIVQALLARNTNIGITETVVTAAAENVLYGPRNVEFLLAGATIKVTQAIVAAAALNQIDGKEIMLALVTQKPNTEITEAAVLEIANKFDKSTMEILLATNSNIEITETIIVAAAGNEWSGYEVVVLLLERGLKVQVTEAVVTAAAGNEWSGHKVMELLLARDANIRITEELLVVAAGNEWRAKEIVQVLLVKDPHIRITEAIMTAAAGNEWNGCDIVDFLLGRDTQIEITTEVVTAAARNNSSGKWVMKMLLARDPNIVITEAIVAAAAGNEYSGKEVMELLLARDPNVDTMEELEAE